MGYFKRRKQTDLKVVRGTSNFRNIFNALAVVALSLIWNIFFTVYIHGPHISVVRFREREPEPHRSRPDASRRQHRASAHRDRHRARLRAARARRRTRPHSQLWEHLTSHTHCSRMNPTLHGQRNNIAPASTSCVTHSVRTHYHGNSNVPFLYWKLEYFLTWRTFHRTMTVSKFLK